MRTFQKGNSSGSFIRVRLNLNNLEAIESALGTRMVARVGVLGGHNARVEQMKGETHAAYKRKARQYIKTKEGTTGSQTNAYIGLVHEKGSLSRGIRRRSFLEIPLIIKVDQLLEVRNSLLENFIHGGEHSVDRLRAAYRDLGIIAENIIQRAFASGGYGQWPPDSDTTKRRKRSSAPLIDTAQLRKSISSDVVNR